MPGYIVPEKGIVKKTVFLFHSITSLFLVSIVLFFLLNIHRKEDFYHLHNFRPSSFLRNRQAYGYFRQPLGQPCRKAES